MRQLVLALAILVFAACSGAPVGTTLTNDRSIVSTGAPARLGAVRFVGDSIVAVGDVAPARGDSVIDGGGLVLAPGFIDTHSHRTGNLLDLPEALGAVSQGITTISGGNDGNHPYPLAQAIDTLVKVGPSVNAAYYAGHGDLRSSVMLADFERVATPAQVDCMAVLLQQEMDADALGLSTGLEHDPGIYSARGEVLALAKAAARNRGRHISHIRSEDRGC